jgi:hypothetical protein
MPSFPMRTASACLTPGGALILPVQRAAGKALELRIRLEARSIADKYVEPPHTTDFAILFLPTEGLYAEVLRRPGLMHALQREHRITLAGLTTLLAMLSSLQMGFRTLALEKRSSEVWQVLGAVKTEFEKFTQAGGGIAGQPSAGSDRQRPELGHRFPGAGVMTVAFEPDRAPRLTLALPSPTAWVACRPKAKCVYL